MRCPSASTASHIIYGARLITKERCSRSCHETAGSQGCAQVPEARHETLWPATVHRHGQASVISGGVEGDRQRGLSRDRALAQQSGRELAPAVQTTRTRNGQIQGRKDPAEIRCCPYLDPQPRPSSSLLWNGWIGSTTGGSWSPLETPHWLKSRNATTPCSSSQPWRHESSEMASAKPGAAHDDGYP